MNAIDRQMHSEGAAARGLAATGPGGRAAGRAPEAAAFGALFQAADPGDGGAPPTLSGVIGAEMSGPADRAGTGPATEAGTGDAANGTPVSSLGVILSRAEGEAPQAGAAAAPPAPAAPVTPAATYASEAAPAAGGADGPRAPDALAEGDARQAPATATIDTGPAPDETPDETSEAAPDPAAQGPSAPVTLVQSRGSSARKGGAGQADATPDARMPPPPTDQPVSGPSGAPLPEPPPVQPAPPNATDGSGQASTGRAQPRSDAADTALSAGHAIAARAGQAAPARGSEAAAAERPAPSPPQADGRMSATEAPAAPSADLPPQAAPAASPGAPLGAAATDAWRQMAEPGWAAALGERIALELTEDGSRIEISLNPETLGHLEIAMQIVDGAAQITMTTETAEAARLLNQQEARLSEALARSGISLAGHSATADRDAGQTRRDGRPAAGAPGGDPAEPRGRPLAGPTAGLINILA